MINEARRMSPSVFVNALIRIMIPCRISLSDRCIGEITLPDMSHSGNGRGVSQ